MMDTDLMQTIGIIAKSVEHVTEMVTGSINRQHDLSDKQIALLQYQAEKSNELLADMWSTTKLKMQS